MAVVGHLLRQFGLLTAFGLLYLEESGVPTPITAVLKSGQTKKLERLRLQLLRDSRLV